MVYQRFGDVCGIYTDTQDRSTLGCLRDGRDLSENLDMRDLRWIGKKNNRFSCHTIDVAREIGDA